MKLLEAIQLNCCSKVGKVLEQNIDGQGGLWTFGEYGDQSIPDLPSCTTIGYPPSTKTNHHRLGN